MHNIMSIFLQEVKLLGANIVTAVIVLGLVFLPSIFTWYNVLSCWDVFDNTGNLKVAVANSDDGYSSDLLPLEVNVGDEVVSALRENTQIDWVFVDEAEAIDGAASGKYYAAVVIPSNFSEKMLTFYEGEDDESADLVYYANQKKNAIAPKIIGQGADTISYQVNETFAETISKIGVSIATALDSYLDKADSMSRVATVADDLSHVSKRLNQGAQLLSIYGTLASTSQELLNSTSELVGTASDSAQTAIGIASDAASSSKVSVDELQQALSDMSVSIGQSKESLKKILEGAKGTVTPDVTETIAQLEKEKESVDSQIESYQKLLEELQKDPEQYADAIEATQLAIDALTDVSSALQDSIDELSSGAVERSWEDIKAKITAAIAALDNMQSVYENNLRSSLSEVSEQIVALSSSIDALSSKVSTATDEIRGSIGSTESDLSNLNNKLSSAAGEMSAIANKVDELAEGLKEALNSNDIDKVRSLLASGVDTLSAALSAPVTVERNAVFPSSSFGSSMFPLYSAIGLFVGALLLLVLFQPHPSERVMETFPDHAKPTRRQQFVGHFGVIAVVSLLQTTILGLGSIFFLQAQVLHPFLFMVCLWLSGLVFAFIMYTLVFSLSNVGKAVGVILLVVQVTGSGGSFPLSILPDFVQKLSSFLPAYHIVNAMRAAMFGVYQGDFYIEMVLVLLFAVPFLVFFMVFARPLGAFFKFYVRRAAESKLLS